MLVSRLRAFFVISLASLQTVCFAQAPKPKVDATALFQAHSMLRVGFDHIRSDYYDPGFHGIDLDARFRQYDAMLDHAQSLGQLFGVISGFLSGFKDSHLYFHPPMRPVKVEPGYKLEAFGEQSFITHLRPNTDAAEKLHVGDQVQQLNGFKITRTDLLDMQVYFHVLSPSPQDRLGIGTTPADAKQITINSVVIPRKDHLDLAQNDNDYRDLVIEDEGYDHRDRDRFYASGDVLIWKLPSFGDLDSVNKGIWKAQGHSLLILDLRGNGGGRVDELTQLVGRVFDHDVKIADRVGEESRWTDDR